MDELISVILPVYNAGKYLRDSIESILNQSYKNFELIIINDGSKDESLNVIEEYKQNDERIIVINRENRGLIASLNEGIEKSRGNYIARMDQDDISLENRLEIQYEYMKDNNLDICGGDYLEIDENSVIIVKRSVFQNDYEILLTMASNVPFAHPSVMIKKDFLKSNKLVYGMNGHREAEDLDLWINMYNNGARFGNVDDYILKYRILPTSMSRVNHKKIMYEVDKQFNKFMQNNLSKFEQTLMSIDTNNLQVNSLSIVYIRALLRYSLIKINPFLFYSCIKKVTFFHFLRGLLSFIKLKYM